MTFPFSAKSWKPRSDPKPEPRPSSPRRITLELPCQGNPAKQPLVPVVYFVKGERPPPLFRRRV